MPRTVIVVDDDEALRDSLELLMASVGLEVLTYASAASFLGDLPDVHPACIVMDIRMPGMSGAQLFAELSRGGVRWPVLFLTGHGDVPLAVELMREGAFDFLEKPCRESQLIDRVQQAIDLDAESRRSDADLALLRSHYQALTAREKEIYDALTQGKANKAIAIELGISQRTVELHRARVMEKMTAASFADLLRMKFALDGETAEGAAAD